MKTKEVDGTLVSIRFHYGRTVRKDGKPNGTGLKPNETLCEVVIDDSERFEGISRKYKTDVFCKEKARKTSLEIALTACLDRTVRTKVWQAYWMRKG
jgi:hypothetical protein